MNAQMTSSKVFCGLGSHSVAGFGRPDWLFANSAHPGSLVAAHGMTVSLAAQNPQIIPAE